MPNDVTTDMSSILLSVKQHCKLPPDYDVYDGEIIDLINAELNTLNQAGVGVIGFQIEDETSKWEDFLGEDASKLSIAKQFVNLRVQLMFDPPANSFVQQAKIDRANELLWRANVQTDPPLES